MAESYHPFLLKGALIQISELMLGFVPNMIFFQYNPENLARTIQTVGPTDPDGRSSRTGEEGDTESEAPLQPTDPRETITLTLELDATDDLEDPRGLSELAPALGVADRIAAIEMLTYPQESGALTSLVAASGDSPFTADLQKAPIVLFFWGPGKILPVRITSLSITEKIFNAYLQPEHATARLSLRVLRPDEISREHNLFEMSFSEALAVGAYEYSLGVKEGLALLSTADEVLDHVIQWLLIEYLSNLGSAPNPFPLLSDLDYPGVTKAGGMVDRIGGVNVATPREGGSSGRGMGMPAISLAVPTHSRGKLHINSLRWNPDNEMSEGITQRDTVDRWFRAGVTDPDAQQWLAIRDPDQPPPALTPERELRVALAFERGARNAYESMKDHMVPALYRALQEHEVPYYRALAAAAGKVAPGDARQSDFPLMAEYDLTENRVLGAWRTARDRVVTDYESTWGYG